MDHIAPVSPTTTPDEAPCISNAAAFAQALEQALEREDVTFEYYTDSPHLLLTKVGDDGDFRPIVLRALLSTEDLLRLEAFRDSSNPEGDDGDAVPYLVEVELNRRHIERVASAVAVGLRNVLRHRRHHALGDGEKGYASFTPEHGFVRKPLEREIARLVEQADLRFTLRERRIGVIVGGNEGGCWIEDTANGVQYFARVSAIVDSSLRDQVRGLARRRPLGDTVSFIPVLTAQRHAKSVVLMQDR